MEQITSWEANKFSASQEILRIIMKPEGSLPRLQQPATPPYYNADQSSPYPIPLPEDPF